MKKITLSTIPCRLGSGYPPPHDQPCRERIRFPLGRSQGLTAFGVNLAVIPPGTWSSQRHWHSHEDEFIWVVEGELTLISDAGEETLRAGECAAFKAGDPNGHHLMNKTAHPAKVLEIGNSDARDRCHYSDIDMTDEPGGEGFRHRDGSLYKQD
ncbi:MAG: cupin domain-containing protein [Steroidobacteraceae bacterium]